MTFDDTRIKPDQEFDLTRDPNGQFEYPTKYVRVAHLPNCRTG